MPYDPNDPIFAPPADQEHPMLSSRAYAAYRLERLNASPTTPPPEIMLTAKQPMLYVGVAEAPLSQRAVDDVERFTPLLHPPAKRTAIGVERKRRLFRVFVERYTQQVPQDVLRVYGVIVMFTTLQALSSVTLSFRRMLEFEDDGITPRPIGSHTWTFYQNDHPNLYVLPTTQLPHQTNAFHTTLL